MSEEITFLSEEELLAGIASVGGPKKKPKNPSSSSQSRPADRKDSAAKKASSKTTDHNKPAKPTRDKPAEQKKQASAPAKKPEERKQTNAPAKKPEERKQTNAPAQKPEEKKQANVPAQKPEEKKQANAPAKKLEERKQTNAPAQKPEEKKQVNTPAQKPEEKKQANVPAQKPEEKKQVNTPAQKPEEKKQANVPAQKPEEKKQVNTPAQKPEERKQTNAPAKKQEERKQTNAPAKKPEERKQTNAPAKKQEERKQTNAPAKKQEERKQTNAPAKKQEERKQANAPAQKPEERKQTNAPAQKPEERKPVNPPVKKPAENTTAEAPVRKPVEEKKPASTGVRKAAVSSTRSSVHSHAARVARSQPEPSETVQPEKPPKPKTPPLIILRNIARVILCVVTAIALLVVGGCLFLHLVFNGPSPAARDGLTRAMLKHDFTSRIPAVFLGREKVLSIENGDTDTPVIENTPDNTVHVNKDADFINVPPATDEPADGIQIETVHADTYTAHVMIVKDPTGVYLATSGTTFVGKVPGAYIGDILEQDGALAGINGGTYPTTGTDRTPKGLVISMGEVLWEKGMENQPGFVGFDMNNKLIVADTITTEDASTLGIRDGCSCGPVLIKEGIPVESFTDDACMPRTAIGQRADGAVIFVCIDGWQIGSQGGTYADVIELMNKYGAVNACSLSGGSSSAMVYRDTEGRMGEAGQVHTINSGALLLEESEKMPTFFMVRPVGEG